MTEAEKLASWEQAVQEDLETMRRHLPQGYVIVPEEPTEEMIESGDRAEYDCSEDVCISVLIGNDGVASVYKAMIKAAQKEGE